MVFFALNQYLATNFHLHIFLLGSLFLSYLLLEVIYQYILFQIIHKFSLFLFFVDAYAMQYFTFRLRKSFRESHLTKVQTFFYKTFEEFNNDSISEKVRLQQLRKAKYSILASILHIFQKKYLKELYIYLFNTLCKSHSFLISYFESGNIFKTYFK